MTHSTPPLSPRPYVRRIPTSRSIVPPARPENEAARTAALHALDILDTAADRRFDRVTALASDAFGVASAVVSLVDENRQWFRSPCAAEPSDGPQEATFCGYAILSDTVFVVEDARLDARFAQSRLVVGPPFVRFYAGAVLRDTTAAPIGTLCLIDSSPRLFDRAERRRLLLLAELVEQEIAHHADMRALRKVVSRLGS